MNYTTIEQSNKLLELGLNPETADMIHWKMPKDEYYEHENIIWLDSVNTLRRKGLVNFDETEMEIIPAWSLSALLAIMPKLDEQNSTLECCSDKTGRIVSYTIEYWNIKNIGYYNTALEAAYKMVVWLLENGYIKTEKMTQEVIDKANKL